MKRTILFLLLCCIATAAYPQDTLFVERPSGDMTRRLQSAIDRAQAHGGYPTVICLAPGDYLLSCDSASQAVYHVSNTTSEAEQPNPVKHIALWLKGLKNVTFDGGGARLRTWGPVTSIVVDECENIHFKNFKIEAIDPTVAELEVQQSDSLSITLAACAGVNYKVQGNRVHFMGHNWSFANGIAQMYDFGRDETWRCANPLDGAASIDSLSPSLFRVNFREKRAPCCGDILQLRDGRRTELCALVNRSQNVAFDDVQVAFTGNFGIVGQMSQHLTFSNVSFEPPAVSGRTCAGFADFLQVSGCRGNVSIENCRFVGAQDDAINVHGTHLRVVGKESPSTLRVRYMHPQTYGFSPFLPGDSAELVDAHSLQPLTAFKVEECRMASLREWLIKPDCEVQVDASDEVVVENISATPTVEIRHCYFSRIPTRGILLTTRRKVAIEHNTFYRTQMSAILIADDARSWFESGPVKDVTIKGNDFVECGEPVILVAPENDVDAGAVHRGICVVDNRFVLRSETPFSVQSTEGFTEWGNLLFRAKKRAPCHH